MKITIYEKWLDTPESDRRSFKTLGSPKKLLDTQNHTINKIMQRLASRRRSRQFKTDVLVVVKDKSYENCLIGSNHQVYSFVRDCLVDEGYMHGSWARKK